MKTLSVVLVTPEGKLFEGEANFVNLPGSCGSFGVYPDHAAIVSTLQTGNIEIALGQEKKTFNVESGVIEVLNNKVSILVEKIIHA